MRSQQSLHAIFCASFLVIDLMTGRLCAAPNDADLILRNGKVVTVDGDFSFHTALAVKDGRILSVGSDAEVLKSRGEKTKVVDLGGKTVLPGLADSHVHP